MWSSTYIQNRAVAVGTSGAKQVVVVRFAIRFPIAFEEIPSAQFLGAMRASEMLWMPSLSQRGDDLSDDGFFAGAAASLLAGGDTLAAHICL